MGVYVPVDWAKADKVDVSTPLPEIVSRFDLSTEYAADSFKRVEDFINDLQDELDDIELPNTSLEEIETPALLFVSTGNRPEMADISLSTIPTLDVTPPVWTPVPTFETPEFPEFNIDPPTYEAPEKPSHDFISDPGDPPAVQSIEFPAKPDLELPTAPNLADIEFPSPPSISITPFEGEVPTETWDMPANFSYTEADYDSDIWADLLSKVLTDIRNGGTGLDVDVETDIYNRALARQETENLRFYEEIEDFFEARGHDLPPGAMNAALYEANKEISNKNDLRNSEITISQAELAQKNTHFMVEQGVRLEGMLRDFFNAQANRTYEAAKTIAMVGIDVFNAKVNKFNARIASYQAQASIYESNVRAALVQVDIYKSQIEASRVTSEVQKNLVDIYTARINALDTYIRLYATEMEGTKIKAEVEQTKLEVFRSQVQVYLARLEADKAKFDVYVRELEGEKTKAAVYSEQVRGYLGEVEAAKTESDVQVAAAEVALKTNQQLVDKYRAELDCYDSEVTAVVGQNAALIDGFKIEAMTYSAFTEAQSTWFRAKTEEMRVRVEEATLNLDRAKTEITASLQAYLGIKELKLAAAEGIMNVGAQLVASSLNAVTATATMSYTGSKGASESWTHGEQITEDHPFEDEQQSG